MADVEIYFENNLSGIQHMTARTLIAGIVKEVLGVYPVSIDGHLVCRSLSDADARLVVDVVNEREGYAAKILK